MSKEHAHQLLDELDPRRVEAVSRLLEVMADPVTRGVTAAPIDDEPVTAEDRRFLDDEKWFAHQNGHGIAI